MTIKDLFDGKQVRVWEDEELVFLDIQNVTVSFTKDDWKEIKKDFKDMTKGGN